MTQSEVCEHTSSSRGAGATAFMNLAWGFSLATSWTWCIGMFLPIILMRLFGWPGVAAFVIPNVLGCALFGFVRSRQKSRHEVALHGPMMALFSAVTIAYQAFFAGWILGPLLAEGTAGRAGVAALAGAGMLLLGMLSLRFLIALSALVFLGSVTVLLTLPLWDLAPLPALGELSPTALLAAIPTLAFGFLLCPTLDLTFHRARQEAPNERAFTIFGFAFASMLVLTLCYGSIAGALTNPAVLLAHIAPQLVVTGAMHARELRKLETNQSSLFSNTPLRAWMLAPLATLAGVLIAAFAPGEDSYLRILGAYGLLFPVYVLIAMSGHPQRPTRTTLFWVAIAVAASIPFLELGFIGHTTYLLPLAVVIPGLAYFIASAARARNTANSE